MEKATISKLIAQGAVRPPVRSLTAKQLRTLLKPLPRSSRLAEALREDRAQGR